jgi:hypothetical protein
MRKDNTQNYETPNTRIQHFSDFNANKGAEKSELGKVQRSFTDNEDQVHNLPNLTKYKYNKVTHKMDNLSKDEVTDKINAIDAEGSVEPKHTFKLANDEVNPNHTFKNNTEVKESKIVKSFEAFTGNFGPGVTDVTPKSDIMGPEDNEQSGCGCCDDCTGEMGCPCGCEDCTCSSDEVEEYTDEMYGEDEDVEYEHEGVESYMFFGNIQTIHRQACEICEMDEHTVNELLNQGHNWAEDHVSVAKELVSQVHNFLMNKGISENMDMKHENENYMFFANIESLCRMGEELMEMDEDVVEELLENGHDWAEDHISAAKEDLQQVYEFLKTEIK